mgnify:CR=1 FL=1
MISILGRLFMLAALAACSMGAVAAFAAGSRKSEQALRFARWMVWVFFFTGYVIVILWAWSSFSSPHSAVYILDDYNIILLLTTHNQVTTSPAALFQSNFFPVETFPVNSVVLL